MNNAINEIKNTLEATNNRITEAEERISELEDRPKEYKVSILTKLNVGIWHATIYPFKNFIN